MVRVIMFVWTIQQIRFKLIKLIDYTVVIRFYFLHVVDKLLNHSLYLIFFW